jgi:hypothetical protein
MRRRLLLALALVVGVFLLPSPASAAGVATADPLEYQSAVDAMLAVDPTLDAPPNDGKHDFVVGGFQSGDYNFGVSAHSGPLGEAPLGYVSATTPLAKANTTEAKQGRWRVTCVNVVGKLAAIGGVPTQAASNDFDFPVVFVFRDGGPGGGTPVEPDGFYPYPGKTGDSQACPDPFFMAQAAVAPPIESGNILVHDAQP